MKSKLDQTNRKLVKELIDGRKPYSSVADRLGITENTVRSRVNKMVDEGVFKVMGVVDPSKMPSLQVIYLGVKLNTMDLEKKAEEFAKLRGVISVSIVTGSYDLMAQVLLSEAEGFTLLDFFKDELVKVQDIGSVETFVVYQSNNLFVPYNL